MAFTAAADYDKFMGRFSEPLARVFADRAGVAPGQRALDVGCGTGALTRVLIDALGLDHVEAVDPSPHFVDAVADRFPGLVVRQASAERLPQTDASVDVALSQLVVHFMADPTAGLAEMARVTTPGGTVGACVWNLEVGGDGPLSVFHAAVADTDPEWVDGQITRPGTRRGDLAALFRSAGLEHLAESMLTIEVPMASFEAWWEPFQLGAGPAGDYVRALSIEERADLERRARERLPQGAFTVRASAWCVIATV